MSAALLPALPVGPVAPELDLAGWLNSDPAPALRALRGRVVLLHAFQMLCPGCVAHGLPQAAAAFEHFGPQGLAVIGLHSVFEHHRAMGPDALAAFVHEYRLRFPIGIDRPGDDGPIPTTMRRYRLQGTPSLVLIDRAGRIRASQFGRVSDLALGGAIGRLLAEPGLPDVGADPAQAAPACSADGCPVPE
ncbi:redoxin domain-containing protein [Vulcaniibacterium thermophilum]|jgi:hypothetical protein|uniref:Alkyl hydroperoxide reductase subunit C/ Thiol specific antioxidant domain-containing protein n=1 Tax=Vulcaniibacterium thermophilum TaxID=1169913 RepID=A0A918Z2L9_9GAMM|nr:redoxin domain-containing protein [Vulcaniibacterium thermophilum]GHE33924.1 hypothetical protein GCM10007167_14980 [Vulcaniibacterium thermophilum]